MLVGEVSFCVVLINSFFLVLYIGVLVVNRKKDKFNGFIVLVIICWWLIDIYMWFFLLFIFGIGYKVVIGLFWII